MANLESVLLTVAVLCLTTTTSQKNSLVSQQCLGCICEAISSCDTSSSCIGNVCGPFRITYDYWADSGKPTVNNESPNLDTAYANCTSDAYCSILAVQGYMNKFQKDCNRDGEINCDDFVTIHKLGGYGCVGGVLSGIFLERYQQCKTIVGLI